ncbi:uncharacterized protein [Nicotiana tomentosiformis]|uniref:uncharacterized protein n=1 Tax=Nicotiana tomentosiformis TaxID=4098 RepID=UPI00388C9A50
MAKELKKLTGRVQSVKRGKGIEGLNYEDCIQPYVELPEGYKPPKFEMFDKTGDPKAPIEVEVATPTPFKVEVTTPFTVMVAAMPSYKSNAIPWDYVMEAGRKGKAKMEETGVAQDMTRTGRVYTPEHLGGTIIETASKSPVIETGPDDLWRKFEDKFIARVLIVNIYPLTTLKRLSKGLHEIRAGSMNVKVFDGSQRATIGETNLNLQIGPTWFDVEFQVFDISATYNLLLGRPWIHAAGVVASTLHQVMKFEWDHQEVIIHGDGSNPIYTNQTIPVIEKSRKLGGETYYRIERVNKIEKDKCTTFGLWYEYTLHKYQNWSPPWRGPYYPLEQPVPHLSQSFHQANMMWEFKEDEVLVDIRNLFLDEKDMDCSAIVEEREEEGLIIQTMEKGAILKKWTYLLLFFKFFYNTIITYPDELTTVTCNETTQHKYNDLEDLEEDIIPEEIVREVENYENKPKSNLDETQTVNLGDSEIVKETRVSIHLSPLEKAEYVRFLKEYEDIFAWSYDDMTGLSTSIVDHKLPTNPMCLPVQPELNPAKCAFGFPAGKLLGFIVSHREIELDPSKVKAIQDLPPPKNKKDVMSFLGRLNCISRFIAQLTVICDPIFKMLKEETSTSWTEECQKAFDKIKEYLSKPPVLVPPEPGRPLLLYLSVSDVAFGCVLGQHDETRRKKHAMYYLSKKFTTYKKEFADALATLSSMIQHPDKNFIDPIPVGIHNQPTYCAYIEEEYYGNPWFHDIKEYLAKGEYPEHENHTQKCTLRRLSNHFFKSDGILYKRTPDLGLLWYVQKCHQCQVHADMIGVPPNELNATSAPWPFSAWGMDVIGTIELAASNGQRFILVAIDYFSKWVEAASYKAVTKKVVADFVRDRIVYQFGVPESIITDNATNLNSDLMKSMCETFKIKHKNSTAYMPQMNGDVEAANKNIKKILSKMIDNHKQWHEKLPFAKLGYRTTVDKAKVEAIEKLPPPTSVKGIRSFLGHAGFYRRFIKDFSKISSPLCRLLDKDVPFKFDDACLRAFEELKGRLVTAPIIIGPDWAQSFELMCDASDIAIGAILGQRRD